jgi:hypothetical protein
LDLPSSITLKNTYNKQTYTPEIEKALKEYEALNYEDIVGGIPTRFKYRETQKTNYGMSTEEILNRYVVYILNLFIISIVQNKLRT